MIEDNIREYKDSLKLSEKEGKYNKSIWRIL